MRNITHLLRNSSRKYWLFNVIYDVIWIGSWWSFCWIWAKISWWWCSMMTMNPVTSSSSPIYHHIYIIFIPYLHHIYHHIYIIFTILSSYLHHIYIIFSLITSFFCSQSLTTSTPFAKFSSNTSHTWTLNWGFVLKITAY